MKGWLSRAKRSTPVRRPPVSTSSWRSRRESRHEVQRGARRAGVRRGRGVQAALPLRRRPSPGRRRRGRRSRLRGGGRTRDVGARRRAVRRLVGRPARGAGGRQPAVAREGVLLDGRAPARSARRGRRCGAASSPRPRRRCDAGAHALGRRIGPRHARRSPRRRRARPRSRPRRTGRRRQRPRPRDVRGRPRRAARARRTRAAETVS